MEMRDRLIVKQRDKAIKKLENYKKVLISRVAADWSPEQQELLATELVINNGGNLEVDNRIYSEVFNRQWVDAELARIIESKNLPNPWVQRLSTLLLGAFVLISIWYFNFRPNPENPSPSPTASPTASPTGISESELINAAIQDGKNNRVVPSSIDKLCQIADNSVIKDAVFLIQGWYQDKYWGPKVKEYIKQNPNCPAIKAFATQQFLGNP